ncbi:MAG: ribosome maturation factor RimP, partial [Gemmatimonadales bacterium]
MTLSDSLEATFRSRVEAVGFDLADLRIGGTPQRPLVQVRIDWPPGESRRVGVAECATVSRTLEAWLDAGEGGVGGLLGRRYQLEVSSP